ncbi:MAG: DNA repair protein RecN [Deltaproteobacteria bacterium]|nr:DNA repair protein RecN [Deltaproteobacteria bacterium]
MLSEIHIKNFNIAESLKVEFDRGFHVISGETGAGKSILLQAIAFALGARADAETIRAGADEAVVTLLLEIDRGLATKALFESLGVSFPEDASLIIKRSLNSSGRSRALVNDEPVTLKTLQALGQKLVHLVRQHAAHQLLEEDFLLGLLDRFGGHGEALSQYRKGLERYRVADREWRELNERIRQTRQQEEFLRYQAEELAKAALKEGEEEELESLKSRLKHRVALATQNFEMRQLLMESDDSVSDRLGKILHLAEKGRELDESLAQVLAPLNEAIAAVDQAGRLISGYGESLQEDPAELDHLEDRLALISSLKRKYHRERAETERRDSQPALMKSAADLHAERKASAKKLTAKLLKSLQELALPEAKIQYLLEVAKEVGEYRENGADHLTLLVSFNPGEEARPFAEIISGGELSRLLLAFYEIVFPAEEVGSFIFDEVDAGVGGKVAELIGRKLESLSKKTQVLCVTHLPQIACYAAHHYTVEKTVRQGRTYSEIRHLTRPEREQEIARMLAGVEITPQALKHARELLKNTAA